MLPLLSLSKGVDLNIVNGYLEQTEAHEFVQTAHESLF